MRNPFLQLELIWPVWGQLPIMTQKKDIGVHMWTRDTALDFMAWLEESLKDMNVHVALAGSVMYRGWSDKDLDVIIYPHGDKELKTKKEIRSKLESLGFEYLYGDKRKKIEVSPSEEVSDALTDPKDSSELKHVFVTDYKSRRVDFFFLKPR